MILYPKITRLGPGENFVEYPDAITVTESSMAFATKEEKPVIRVVGEIKNNSDVNWRDIQYEVQFFDNDGRLVDIAKILEYAGDCCVAANNKTGFEIVAPRDLPEERYASYKIFVRYARDENAWP